MAGPLSPPRCVVAPRGFDSQAVCARVARGELVCKGGTMCSQACRVGRQVGFCLATRRPAMRRR
eukprot:8281329-Lingulodinium_polyedra.AAC.1